MRIDPGLVYQKFNQPKQKKTEEAGLSEKALVKEGGLIRGEILDIKGQQITLRLPGGEVLTGRMAMSLPLSIGDELNFLIKGDGPDGLILSPDTKNPEFGEKHLIGSLKEMDIAATKENIAILKGLMQSQLQISPKLMRQVKSFMDNNPTVNLRQVLFMLKQEIPLSTENLQLLVEVEQGDSPLTDQLAQVSRNLVELLGDQPRVASSGLFDQLTDSNLMTPKGANYLTALMTMAEVNIEEANGSLLEVDRLFELVQTASDKLTDMTTETGFIKIANMLSDAFKANIPPEGLSEEAAQFVQSLPDLEDFSLEVLAALRDRGFIGRQQFDEILGTIRDEVAKNMIFKGLMIGEKTLTSPKALNTYFNELQEKLTLLSQESSEFQKFEKSDVAQHAKGARDRVDFLGVLNQNINLIHMPILLNDRLSQAELYIMNDREALKNPSATVTALLRLDLVNLGHMDIYVKKSQKNIDVQFQMADETQIPVVKEKVFQLHKYLIKEGLHPTNIGVEGLAKSFDVVEDFLDKKTKDQTLTRYSFDVRA